MQLSLLPQEIITEITANLTVQQAHTLAETSRHFYAATMSHWAACARLESRQQITSFCHFMLDHGDQRPLYLRKLSFRQGLHKLDAGELSILAQVIRKAKGLGCFVDRLFENSLHNSPELFEALRNHPSLVNMNWKGMRRTEGADCVPCHLLATMVSRLRHLTISTCAPDLDLSSALAPHAGTLRAIELEFMDLYVERWPCDMLEMFMRAFPNVKTLYWLVERCIKSDDHPASFEEHWQSLDHLRWSNGPLCFRRLVRRLTLENSPTMEEDLRLGTNTLHVREALQALRVTAPTVLELTYDMELIRPLAEIAPSVKYLRLRTGSQRTLEFWRAKAVSIRVAQALGDMKLVALFIEFCGNSAPEEQELLGTARGIPALVPSLTSIGIEVTWHAGAQGQRSVVSWFNISRDGEIVIRLQLLSPTRGAALEQQLLQMR